jgi:hypothetical protein
VVVATVGMWHCHYHTGGDEDVYIVLTLSITGGDEELCDTVTRVVVVMGVVADGWWLPYSILLGTYVACCFHTCRHAESAPSCGRQRAHRHVTGQPQAQATTGRIWQLLRDIEHTGGFSCLSLDNRPTEN